MKNMELHNENFVTILFKDRVYLINNEDKKVYQFNPNKRMSKKVVKLYDKLDKAEFKEKKYE